MSPSVEYSGGSRAPGATAISAGFVLQRGDFVLDAAFSVPAEGITIISGPSGSGKTSLLRCMAGFERARGTFNIGGKVWQAQDVFVPTHQRSIGYVFQEGGLFPHLTVRGNLELASGSVDNALIEELRIRPLLGRNPGELSGGEKRRVALGRALSRNPELLLMDEPLAGLDSDARQELLPVIRNACHSRGIPMFYVTHSLTEILALGDRLISLSAGSITKSADLSALKPRLEELLQLERSLGVD